MTLLFSFVRRFSAEPIPMMRFFAVLGALLLSACGGSSPPPATPEAAEPSRQEGEFAPPPPAAPAQLPQDSTSSGVRDDGLDEEHENAAPQEENVGRAIEWDHDPEAWRQMVKHHEQLQQALSQGTPNCIDAEHFRSAVCRLADRICEMAEELPRSSSAHGQCEDGRRRCQEANHRFSQRCE